MALILLAVARWGCPLCGGYHELAFHSYPWRWSISRDSLRSRDRVATIICIALRGTGRQYTKRILPEHLIWRSPLWGEGLVKQLAEGRDGEPGFIDAACAELGCIDPRTVRKHTRALRAAVDAKLPVLAELLAVAPESSEGPAFPPGMNPFAILRLLWDRVLETVRRFSGSSAASALRPLLWLWPGPESFQFFNRSCIPIPGPP
jgi:hypothetical protein